jgi:hypothetical protein
VSGEECGGDDDGGRLLGNGEFDAAVVMETVTTTRSVCDCDHIFHMNRSKAQSHVSMS